MRKQQTYSRTSPKSGRRATLGSNGKYSRKNDKGYMINQGIGNLEGQGNSTVANTINERALVEVSSVDSESQGNSNVVNIVDERTLIEVSSRNEFTPIVDVIAVNELTNNNIDGWNIPQGNIYYSNEQFMNFGEGDVLMDSGIFWDGAVDTHSISKTFDDIVIGETYTLDFDQTDMIYNAGSIDVSGIFNASSTQYEGIHSFTGVALSKEVILTGVLSEGYIELQVSRININRV